MKQLVFSNCFSIKCHNQIQDGKIETNKQIKNPDLVNKMLSQAVLFMECKCTSGVKRIRVYSGGGVE